MHNNDADKNDLTVWQRLKPHPHWLSRIMIKLFLLALFIGGGVFIGGFFQFASQVTSYKSDDKMIAADGVVVLTGGADRIAAALDLIAHAKGQRLLISGVNPDTTKTDLEKINPSFERFFSCCVDLESVSVDTVSNAIETKKWLDKNNYQSVVLVTSNYHMPRSLFEFQRLMPNRKIIPYVVRLAALERKGWWKNSKTLRFMISEYIKYIGTHSRDYLSPQTVTALRAGMFVL